MKDLESRLAGRVQLTTGGFRPYISAWSGRAGQPATALLEPRCLQASSIMPT